MKRRPTLYPTKFDLLDEFDSLFKSAYKSNLDGYPATDIYVENGKTFIELAITGFSKEDIDITLDGDTLTIVVEKEKESTEDREYVVKKIAKRNIKKEFTLIKQVEDVIATVENGILTLELIETVPVDSSKKISIN